MEQNPYKKAYPKSLTGSLGTFGGVFTPSLLTILGIILFLRLSYVVGNAGLRNALIIIGLANVISILTSISLSAIATNLKVKRGGDYYLISRTLGVEFGGAIGIVLFLAQSVSIAFYCIGFGEALSGMVQFPAFFSPKIIAVIAVSFLFIFAWLGADWATRFQYVVMLLIAAALFSFFAGGLAKWDPSIVIQNWNIPKGSPGLWILFAIFFPAVTGFTQGVSMSGDLKDPGKSLPKGTFFAVGISLIVYFTVAIIFAGTLPSHVLMNDYGAIKHIARFDVLIDAGVIAATLSSAMASFLGAPRILQALASDHIFSFLKPFAYLTSAGNPRKGVLLSTGVAFLTISLGNLNLIASVVSMFFLISYGLLNYATYFEAKTSSPSFRPKFKWFDYRLSLLGFIACFGALLAIDIKTGVVAISIIYAIYQYLKRTAGPARWADSQRSYHLQKIREHLLAADAEPEHDRDWRPQILALSSDTEFCEHLIRFGNWLEGGSGLTTALKILEGEGNRMLKLQNQEEIKLKTALKENNLTAFPLVVFSSDIQTGLTNIVQSFGIGPLKVNIILLNWIEYSSKTSSLKKIKFENNIKTAFRLGCNIIILDFKQDKWDKFKLLPSNERIIDVWWFNDSTSRLMLLLAYLIKRNEDWSEAKIRVLSPIFNDKAEEPLESFNIFLEEVRIEAEAKAVKRINSDSIKELCSESALVFIPFRLHGNLIKCPFTEKIEALVSYLPIVSMVLAAEDIDLDAEPEEGESGETAILQDTLEDEQKKAQLAEKEAEKAEHMAEEKLKELRHAIEAGNEEIIVSIEGELKEARKHSTVAARKAAKALYKTEEAEKRLEAVVGKPEDNKKSEDPQ